MTGLTGIKAVAAGPFHSIALAADGAVYTWGSNLTGELGDDSDFSRSIPAVLKDIAGVASVSASKTVMYGEVRGFSLARKADGTVRAWGYNGTGQMGDGTLLARRESVVVLREEGGGSVERGDWYLDLDPARAKAIPAQKIPVFLLVASAAGNALTANIRARAQDVGSTQSVYVFALAPASLARPIAPREGEPKADALPVGCVLAQLNAGGQLQQVSASDMKALLTNTLSSQGLAVTVLNGIPTVQIAGATFFVGYGTSPAAMLASGVNRGVVTTPGTVECKPERPQTGWWWNPAEGGRGFSLEVSGNTMFFASFLYDVSGRSTWYAAAMPVSLDGSYFTGRLVSKSGGQTLDGAWRAPGAGADAGTVALAFNDATHGTLVWPGGSFPIQRFDIVADGHTLPPQPNQPEGGWWWNPSEDGRGFFIEWQGGRAFVAGYMYDAGGNPVWYLAQPSTPEIRALRSDWALYANGQSMGAAYRAPTVTNPNVAPVTITFSGPDAGLMTLPGGRTTAITRFRF